MRRLAGRPARSLTCSLTRTRSAETCSGSELFYFLGDYFYLVRIARTQAGEQADRQAGRQAGRVPCCVMPRRARADSAGSGPILKTINGRPASRVLATKIQFSSSTVVVARCSLYRAFLFPPFPVSFRSPSSSIVHSSFPRFLSPSVSTLSSPFLSL